MQEGHGIKIIDRSVIRAARRKMAENMAEVFRDLNRPIVLVCILKGAAYLTVDLSRDLERLGLQHSVYFIEASSYVGQTQNDEIEVLSKLVPEKLQDKHIILVDELYDNGKTMHMVKEHIATKITNNGITTCVMFQKRRKTSSAYALPRFVGMEVPDVWLVGYGMDEDGLYRGLKDVWAVPRTEGQWTPDDWKIFINKET